MSVTSPPTILAKPLHIQPIPMNPDARPTISKLQTYTKRLLHSPSYLLAITESILGGQVSYALFTL